MGLVLKYVNIWIKKIFDVFEKKKTDVAKWNFITKRMFWIFLRTNLKVTICLRLFKNIYQIAYFMHVCFFSLENMQILGIIEHLVNSKLIWLIFQTQTIIRLVLWGLLCWIHTKKWIIQCLKWPLFRKKLCFNLCKAGYKCLT